MTQEEDMFDSDDDGDFELRDAREVNRQLKAEGLAAKREKKKELSGEGLLKGALRHAQRDHAGDPKKQLAVVLTGKSIPAAIGRRRTVSDKRYNDFFKGMHRSLTLLPKVRAPIRNLGDFGRGQFIALAAYWEREGIGEDTVHQYFSVMRRFFALVGKPDLIPKGQELIDLLTSHGITLGTAGRDKIPDMSPAWTVRGVDLQEVVDRFLADGHEVIACLVEMQWRFGLRDMEGVQLKPERDDHGDYLTVDDGTKGGRARVTHFFKDPAKAQLQREALERAKAVARKHPEGRLAVKGLRLQQMYKHFLNTVAAYGITKAGKRVTLHGLRHQYALDLFEDVTGLPAPVLGLLPAAEYERQAPLVRKGYQAVTAYLGHGRKEASNAYLGSPTKLGKVQRRRIEALLEQLTELPWALVKAGVKEAWMTGAAGRGSAMHATEALPLAVRMHDDCDGLPYATLMARLASVREAAEVATGRPVIVTPWAQPGVPEDATEILFPFAVQRPAGDAQAQAGDAAGA